MARSLWLAAALSVLSLTWVVLSEERAVKQVRQAPDKPVPRAGQIIVVGNDITGPGASLKQFKLSPRYPTSALYQTVVSSTPVTALPSTPVTGLHPLVSGLPDGGKEETTDSLVSLQDNASLMPDLDCLLSPARLSLTRRECIPHPLKSVACQDR